MKWSDHEAIALKLLRHKGDDFTPKLINALDDDAIWHLAFTVCGLSRFDADFDKAHLKRIRSAWVERWVWGNKNG